MTILLCVRYAKPTQSSSYFLSAVNIAFASSAWSNIFRVKYSNFRSRSVLMSLVTTSLITLKRAFIINSGWKTSKWSRSFLITIAACSIHQTAPNAKMESLSKPFIQKRVVMFAVNVKSFSATIANRHSTRVMASLVSKGIFLLPANSVLDVWIFFKKSEAASIWLVFVDINFALNVAITGRKIIFANTKK